MSTARTRKLNDTVREALAEVLLEDIEDPRVDLVTITSVDVSPDRRHARVFVTTHGGPEREKAMMAGLLSATRRIRAGLAARVRMRYIPELAFLVDESVDEGARISVALQQERDAGRVPPQEGADPAEPPGGSSETE